MSDDGRTARIRLRVGQQTALKCVLAILSTLCTTLVHADVSVTAKKLEVEYWGGMAIDEQSSALSRFTIRPSLRLQIGNRWRSDLALRAEYASDITGLGSLDTYSALSRPLIDDRSLRVEIERATLTRRTRHGALTLGKQTLPWGILDGVQVTDRFDAVRRRDFVLTETRPERIARWGVRLRTRAAGIGIDLAAMLDPTTSQLTQPGDVFEPQAPRLRGGIPPSTTTPPVRVEERTGYLNNATLGARLSRRFGELDLSVLTLSGPDTEPVLGLIAGSAQPEVLLRYPRRRLHGLTLETALGNTVLRMEAALIPNQPVNVLRVEPLQHERRQRWLAGIGLDINSAWGWFINAQIAIDRVEQGNRPLARPKEDVVATLRAQRFFAQDTVLIKAEILGTLSDGDGAIRPMVEWRASSHLTLSAGGDLLFGDRTGLFGQYRDASRVWVRVRFSL